jgi:hypothetical protein
MEKRKVYELTISPDDNLSGMDFNSFVSEPAHGKHFHYFNKQAKQTFAVNDEKRIVTGVAIAADKLIPRYDEKNGFYDVFFTADTIHQIILKFHEKLHIHNVNLEHNPNMVADGLILFQSYQVNKAKGLFPNDVPDAADGDWVISYFVKNEDVWQNIKKGKFSGFSVEIWANHIERKLFKNQKTEKMTKSKLTFSQKVERLKKVFFEDEAASMNEVTTDAGVILAYEGEMSVGTQIMVSVEGEMLPANEGAYVLTGDLEGVSIILDEAGVVAEIIQPSTEDEPTMDEVAMKAIVDEIKKLRKENKEFKSQFASFKVQFENFAKTPATKPTTKLPQGKNPRAEYFKSLLNKNN